MSDVRNYEEYRAQALASLGEDYTVEDLRNEERFRSKVLDGLGMSYETEDLVNFEKYRLKVLQGIAGGGGGSGDLSTAEMTIIESENAQRPLRFSIISDDKLETQELWGGVYTVPLYKGSFFIMDTDNLGAIASVSGDIEEISSGHDVYFRIYGDCTITL